MFSGLVAALGTVRNVRRLGAAGQVEIAARFDGERIRPGESIAVNGACLTVTAFDAAGFQADTSPETLRRTTLGGLRHGDEVNLERSLRLADRLGGHLVLGHVDATVRLLAVTRGDASFTVRPELPASLAAEVAEKGSVAIDGVSLTVSRLGQGWFEVVIVPATWDATTLRRRRSGDLVNLETDVLAKYVRRAVDGSRPDLASLLQLNGYAAD